MTKRLQLMSIASVFMIFGLDMSAQAASPRGRSSRTPESTSTFKITAAPTATNITKTTANINWSLSQVGQAQVEYGLTTSYGMTSVKENSFKYSSHIQALSNLAAGMTYHYRVVSWSQSGVQIMSGDNTFKTLGASPAPTPTPPPVATPTPKPSPTATPSTPPPSSGSCAPAPTSSKVVSVKDTGAKGDGKTNDTSAIQAAINQVSGSGGTVDVPAGTYMVDALTSLNLGSNMTFKMESGATIQAIANSSQSYDVIKISGQSNVNVIGGSVNGERNKHSGSGGEWGMGISTYGAKNVFIDSVNIQDMWGDGIYLSDQSKNVTICNVMSSNNRRQGVSVVDADTVIIKNSTFQKTNGTDPQAGIDLEPNSGTSVNNVQVSNCKFLNNHSDGILIYAGAGPVTNAVFTGNTVTGNGGGGIEAYNAKQSTFSNNTINDGNFGFSFDSASTGNKITGNDITAPSGRAIMVPSNNTVSNNTSH